MIKNIARIITATVLLSLQSIVNNTYGQSALKDNLYIHLDTSRISSGVLYDRVYPWAELDRFTVQDTVDYNFAKQAWYELYLSTYDRSNIQDADILWKIANKNLYEHNRHTVGYIDYTFHYIDSNALQSGALVLGANDSLLYDGNPTLNPYISKRISIPVINVQKIRKDSAIDFYFDPDVHLSNHINNAVTKIKIITPAGSISLQPDETKTMFHQYVFTEEDYEYAKENGRIVE